MTSERVAAVNDLAGKYCLWIGRKHVKKAKDSYYRSRLVPRINERRFDKMKWKSLAIRKPAMRWTAGSTVCCLDLHSMRTAHDGGQSASGSSEKAVAKDELPRL